MFSNSVHTKSWTIKVAAISMLNIELNRLTLYIFDKLIHYRMFLETLYSFPFHDDYDLLEE